ncbi:MAG: TlpA family protein disulfide reductase [Saprospiraceae bacterium]|nr:TlpA family protein disulfide reductase [Saprospiraceae bacterium]
MENKHVSLAPGIWRAVLQLTPSTITPNKKGQPLDDKVGLKFDEATAGELPFALDIKYTSDSVFSIDIINGDERLTIPAEDIKIGRDRATARDTILINFSIFGSYVRGVFQERVLEGEWVVPAKNLSIPFVARYGQGHRFTTLNKTPKADLTGKWACSFDLENEKPYAAVAELKQNGNILRGTFRTETGDYRFLDGEVQDNKFYLSCFDGAHAFLFEGKIVNNDSIVGVFRSGKTGREIWSGNRNPNADLRDANSLTTVKSEQINFTFPDTDGKKISLNDYAGKVKLVQIMGTWCPNCRDETRFLTEYLTKNGSEKLTVVALAFERNAEIAVAQTRNYKAKMAVPYDILIAGTSTSKEEAAKTLPFLSQVVAFPTLIFIDKNNRVRRVHTGFDGPATSRHAAFASEFDTFVKKLVSE